MAQEGILQERAPSSRNANLASQPTDAHQPPHPSPEEPDTQDGASNKDATHKAPPPANPRRVLGFHPGSGTGVKRRALNGASREEHDAHTRRRRRDRRTVQGFPPGSNLSTRTPPAPDLATRVAEGYDRRGGESRGGGRLTFRSGAEGIRATTARRILAARAAEDAGHHFLRALPVTEAAPPHRPGPLPRLPGPSRGHEATQHLTATFIDDPAGLPVDPLRWRRGGAAIEGVAARGKP